MEIKRSKIDASIERNLITGMIVSDLFLNKIAHVIEVDLLKSFFVKVIARWCLDYYKEFNSAPKEIIKNIYNTNKKKLDETVIEMIDDFLDSISEEYDRDFFNVDFILKECEIYFKGQSLLELSTDIKVLVNQGKVNEAEKRQTSYIKIRTPEIESVDVFNEITINNSFDKIEKDVLFNFPGALGEMIPPCKRTEFIGFIGRMKIGKTFRLIDCALRGVLNNNNVYFITLEMPHHEISLRFYQGLLGEYIINKQLSHSYTSIEREIEIPFFNEEGEVDIKLEKKYGLTKGRVQQKIKALRKMIKGRIKIDNFPADTINTNFILEQLDIEKYNYGFIPDVIIIDYADIMAPERIYSKDARQQINSTWLALRKLAQYTNTCVITGTQGNRNSFKKDIEEDDTSEDIRKLAHVSRMIGINPGGKNKKDYNYTYEKAYSQRLNVLVDRHSKFDTENFVRVLTNFEIGKAYLDSRFCE